MAKLIKRIDKGPRSGFLIADNSPKYLYIVDTELAGMVSLWEDAIAVTKFLYHEMELGDRRLICQDDERGVWEIIHSDGQFLTIRKGHDGIELPSLRDIIEYQLDLMDNYEIKSLWDYIKTTAFR
jgi:hypothetical protein